MRHHGVEEALAAGRHFNRTVEQVVLRNFRERPEGCLRVESGKILRQEVIVHKSTPTPENRPSTGRIAALAARASGLYRRTNQSSDAAQCHWQWALRKS